MSGAPVGPELQFGTEELADLPFLPEAGRLLVERGYGMSLSELAERWSEPFAEAGVRRAREAVLEGRVDQSLDSLPPEHRILSFVVASLVVRATGDQYAAKRFALAEARRLEERLLQRIRRDRRDAAVLLSKVYSRALGVSLQASERVVGPELFDVSMGLRDYLRLSSSLDASRWGIVNRVLDGGRVYLRLEEAARLLRGGIAELIESRLLSLELRSPPEPIAREAARLLEEVARSRPAPARPSSGGPYPPCVTSLLRRLESGENLPHAARFFLASFLINAGVPIDDVVSIFSRSPDFNERVTRYQVEHIAGVRGGKRYSVPSCAKLAAQGLCARDETCGNIRNPISYLRRGSGRVGRASGKRGDRVPEGEL